ncbi:MAG: hypothetical protein MJ237_09385 [bacterium]|nr:hypothetical protein [bacterium]
MTQDVQFLLNNTLAGSIAKKLDAKDGATDGKISASIWNEFVANKGGNTIKNSISIEEAMESITTYAERMAKGWLDAISGTVPPAVDENPPTADDNLPKDTPVPYNIPGALTSSEMNRLNAKFAHPFPLDGGRIELDENGYITAEYDKNENKTREIVRNGDGTVRRYYDYEYDKEGKKTRRIRRHDDGTVMSYVDCEYDENGKVTRAIMRHDNGTVDTCYDYEYDKEGKKTRRIRRHDDGTVMSYVDCEYDENGKMTRAIMRRKDGSVVCYCDYEYDKEGNHTREIVRNPDGSEYTEE